LLFTPGDHHFFHALLPKGATRSGYRVHAFYLMSNHLHLAPQARSCPVAEVAHYFSRDPSTISHLVARLEKASRSSVTVSETLRKHLNAVMQAPYLTIPP
jgi:REP element-mobilizing transposase RayT